MGRLFFCFFFFNDTATTEIYTLSLHDALPIWDGAALDRWPLVARQSGGSRPARAGPRGPDRLSARGSRPSDRKSTRLNSSHANISYAVFCLKKKKNTIHYIL